MSGLAGSETVSTLNGLFKEVYADEIKDLIPNAFRVQNMIPFVPRQKEIGNKYHQPVVLAYPSGFTHAAGDGTAGAFALNAAAASTLKDATIQGAQILLREYLDYESAARASRSRNAFVDATALLFENMQKAHRKRAECVYLYGVSGYGTVSSATSTVLTLTAASWAPLIWAGAEGMSIDIVSSDLQTNRGTGVISAVDIDNYQITVDATHSAVNGDLIFFKGSQGNEANGIDSILTNSGSLFGISAATYSMWKTSSLDASSAALTFNKVKAAIAKAVGRGLDEDVTVLMNPKTWDNVLSDLASLRRFVEKEGKGSAYEIGSENIVFYSQNGKCELVPSGYVKEGVCHGIVKDTWKRVGATDVTFETPGYGGQIFTQLASNAGFEVRSYSHTAIFCEMPARQFYINNIVNAAS